MRCWSATKNKAKKPIKAAHTILARDYKGWQTTRENTAVIVGGVYTKATDKYQRGVLKGLSRAIKASQSDAGIMYENEMQVRGAADR